ncbi:ATP-dependent Clp protease proteolytic subunit [Paraburkholderia sp. SIMBA_054]|uniref:ATP-dependent Clp protease proteolytic subunit n=1 Tax=Paraburkholderia sp. SIMBA_054 TaxID=3085795 RepID=UPI00397C1923
MSNSDIKNQTINWRRCLHIDSVIEDDFVNSLIPRILEMRQESNDPITVAINSPGGSLAALEALVRLLTGPDQDGRRGEIVTVSVRDAHSAAANLLAFGTYAVALPHSEILFHDIRFHGMEDVTPAVARIAADRLQLANEEFALKLANRIFNRLVWNYLDVRPEFDDIRDEWSEKYKEYCEILAKCDSGLETNNQVDIASFATALFSKVSKSSEGLIDQAMQHLGTWGFMTGIAKKAPSGADHLSEGGVLESLQPIFSLFDHARAKDFATAAPHVQAFLTLLIEQLVKSGPSRKFDFLPMLATATDSYRLIESINHRAHLNAVSRNMRRHPNVFFDGASAAVILGTDQEAKKKLMDAARPSARLFWFFCVLLCRALFNGEHSLSPSDAQVLGIVDEVAGGGPIQSRRDFQKEEEQMDAAAQAPVTRVSV